MKPQRASARRMSTRFFIAALLSLGLTMSACGRAGPTKPGPFTVDVARALLPDAASMDRSLVNSITSSDVRPKRAPKSLSELILLEGTRYWPIGASREFSMSGQKDEKLFARLISALELKGPSERGVARRMSVVQSADITSVSIKHMGDDRAMGEVVYRNTIWSGSVAYEATRANGTWNITAFELPGRGTRMERAGKTWHFAKRPLTDSLALKLLHHAAAQYRETYEVIVNKGSKLTPAEIPSLTLFVGLFDTAEPWPPVLADEFSVANPGRSGWHYYLKTLPSRDGSSGTDLEYHPSLLHPDFVRSISVEQVGDHARGAVAFELEGYVSGTVQFEAKRPEGRWTITMFEFPRRGYRLELGDDRCWHAAFGRDEKFPGAMPVVAMPPSGMPNDPIALGIDAKGGLHFKGQASSLSSERGAAAIDLTALQAKLNALSKAGPREPDGTSAFDLVLVVDGRAEWKYAQQVLQVAAESNVSIHRVHFAFVPKAGARAAVIANFLPKDNDRTPQPVASNAVTINVSRHTSTETGEQSTLVKIGATREFHLRRNLRWESTNPNVQDLISIRAAVADEFKARGANVLGEIAAPSPTGGTVPFDHILTLFGILRDSGAKSVVFR